MCRVLASFVGATISAFKWEMKNTRMLCHVSDVPRARALAYTNLTSSDCCDAVWTTRNTPIIIIRLSMWNVSCSSLLLFHHFHRSLESHRHGVREHAVSRQFFCCCWWVFQSHPDRTRWNFVSDAVRMQLPIITMGYMSCSAKVFSKIETATTHVFAQMHDEKWHMRRTKQERTRETLGGRMPLNNSPGKWTVLFLSFSPSLLLLLSLSSNEAKTMNVARK